MAKIVAITGMCSSANKPTGYQFVPEDNKLVARGSFRMYGGGDEVVSDVAGNFYTAPTFKCTCGMEHLYQCKECGSFVCYDGKAHEKLQCPSCHTLNYVPAAAPDGRIARSGKAGGAMVDIVLAIDTSSSMNAGGRLAVVKQAAVEEFVARYEGKCRMAVMSFDTKVSVLTPLTDNLSAVKRLIGTQMEYASAFVVDGFLVAKRLIIITGHAHIAVKDIAHGIVVCRLGKRIEGLMVEVGIFYRITGLMNLFAVIRDPTEELFAFSQRVAEVFNRRERERKVFAVQVFVA